jgi:hypothetical protein
MPVVTWTKGRNTLEDSADLKVYYDQSIDVHFMEIFNCKQKDAGTYQVTATNQFGVETAPVTLMFTHNPEDVIDYKTNLKNRSPRVSAIEEEGPDWGKLRKAGSKKSSDEEDAERIKLKHFEREKQESEPIKKEAQKEVKKILKSN